MPAVAAAWRLVVTSQILRRSFDSRVLKRAWDYVVYVPEAYEAGGNFPIVYLLHGAVGAASDFVELGDLQRTANRLTARRFISPAIIVTPNSFESWYIDSRFMLMQQAFLDEFIAHIESELRVRRERSARSIAGISAGGYGALRFALLRPDLFSAAALMSAAAYGDEPPPGSRARFDEAFLGTGAVPEFDAAFWTSNLYPTLLEAYLQQHSPVRFHIACGDHDELGNDAEALRLYRFLRAQDQDALFRLAPGGHDWTTWKLALDEALRFLLEPSTDA